MIRIFLCGLAAAQIVATIHVWFSNQSLSAALLSMKTAGYFIVPGALVTPPLLSFKAAFLGGLFFTLTIGAGATLVTFALTYYCSLAWRPIQTKFGPDDSPPAPGRAERHFLHHSTTMLIGGLFWLYLLIRLNIKGLCLIESLYLLAIPAIVAPLTYQWVKKKRTRYRFRYLPISLAPILFLTLIWSTQWDESLFVRVRDHLLLETGLGRAINDFYYRYTLYPAEAFKPISQKMLKACCLKDITDRNLARRTESALRRHDYLAVADADVADLKVSNSGSTLIFLGRNAPPVKFEINAFISDPDKVLETVSDQNDPRGFFRLLVFWSLLVGFPVLLYALCFGMLLWPINRIAKPLPAMIIAACVCFMVGLALFWPMRQSKTDPADLSDLKAALRSERWQTRVAALQRINHQGIEIAGPANYQKSLSSRHISERYWLARALAVSKTEQTYGDLFKLLKDPHPNVRCQAFYGLGLRRRQSATVPIHDAIQNSDHWYIQWYGYKALRSLGWIQPQSRPEPF